MTSDHSLTSASSGASDLLALAHPPTEPRAYRPALALIGCGGIARHHLAAYQQAGYLVSGLCDQDLEKAESCRQAFYPGAQVFDSARELLATSDAEIVDITTHPAQRPALIEEALRADRHVLSQKPFVLDLDDGERLAALAEARGRILAVNQNGRWAPHFAFLRRAVAAGHVGRVQSVEFSLQFDHNWTAGTAFDDVHHLILFDFAVHWFDMLLQLVPHAQAEAVSAAVRRSPAQRSRPPLLAHALVTFPDALGTLHFSADTRFEPFDRTVVVGSEATAISEGPDYNLQRVRVTGAAGSVMPRLTGSWFDDGFHGAMAALLRAIEDGRRPSHDASGTLRSLELCFAAVASADAGGVPVVPGSVRRLPDSGAPS
jgi:predicted dehydrogenase